MQNIQETDQWLLNGECNKCRRQSYCKKKCGAIKRAWQAGLKQAVASALEKRMEEKNKTE